MRILTFGLTSARTETGQCADVTALYRRYGAMVLSRCRQLLRNDADAQEACQEVFLKVHRFGSSFRGDANPSTFLYRVATNTCLNRIRTRKRRPEELIDEHERYGAAVEEGAGERERRLAEWVTRLAEDCDERTRELVLYVYVDGLTQEEAGQIVGISASAVRKRLTAFRDALRANPPGWLRDEMAS
jgi:RNA polymerase sigma-70 factor (ECF subfamily)